jgi:hypothetical protein
MSRSRRRSRLLRFLCVPAVVCLVAACGSSSSTTAAKSAGSTTAPTTSRAGGPGGTKLSASVEACLKKQGVTLGAGFGGHRGGTPPTGSAPSQGTGTGATGAPPTGAGRTFKRSAKMTAALKACGVTLPTGGAGGGGPTGGAAPASAS